MVNFSEHMDGMNISFPSPDHLEHVGEGVIPPETYGRFVLRGENVVMQAGAKSPVREVQHAEDLAYTAEQHPGEIAVLHGFDLERQLDPAGLGGPVIEVAGPTQRPITLIRALATMPDRLFVSNISRHSDLGEPLISRTGRELDYMADAKHLPHADGSIGAILSSNIDDNVRGDMFGEFSRVLAPHGLLVADGIVPRDLKLLADSGLEPRIVHVDYAQKAKTYERIRLSGVFQKPAADAPPQI